MNIIPSDTGVTINGEYYSVINNYQTKKQGQFTIDYKNLLTVDHVKRRSKELMFIFVVVGSLMAFLISRIGLAILGGNLFAVVAGLAIISFAFILALFFSKKAYIEFTFIGGIVRVPCGSASEAEAQQLVSEIRYLKEFGKNRNA